MRATILTVLKTGGAFRADHVESLRRQCARHASGVAFVCLSDDPAAPAREPLTHGWPGWWSKIEIFRRRGPVLYLDLDSVVVAPLAPLIEIAAASEFVALADFNPGAGRRLASGVMGWNGDRRDLFDAFAANPARHMAENATPRFWGDQGFLDRHVARVEHWQSRAPGAIVSWKKHCSAGVPAGARIVAFHGAPRPWEVDHGLDDLAP